MMTSSNGNIFCVTCHLCGEFTRSFDVFFDLRLNKRLGKQSWSWWFGTLSCPLLRQCYDNKANEAACMFYEIHSIRMPSPWWWTYRLLHHTVTLALYYHCDLRQVSWTLSSFYEPIYGWIWFMTHRYKHRDTDLIHSTSVLGQTAICPLIRTLCNHGNPAWIKNKSYAFTYRKYREYQNFE